MAFTTTEKIEIVRLLGWPANTLNPDSLSYSKIISDRLLNLLPEAEEMVLKLVDRISELDESLEGALGQTGVKRIDDIEFFGSSESNTKLQELRKERNRLINELSAFLDIKKMSGAGGPMGSVCV